MFFSGFVERRVAGIKILSVQIVNDDLQTFAESLIMNDFPLSQKPDGVLDIGIIDEAQNIVVGGPGFLLCCHVFMKIGDGIAFHGKFRGVEGVARGIYGIDADGVVDEVFIETAFFDFVDGEISRQLMYDGADHLEVTELFGTFFRYKNDPRAFSSYMCL